MNLRAAGRNELMLKMSETDFHAIRQHGRETYPEECCGILIGTSESGTRTVKEIVRCGNTRADRPRDRYHIDPQELIRAQLEARQKSLDIIGFYHSHPDHPAQWSLTDLAEAHWLGCSYVITSVLQGAPERTNSFALDGIREEDKHFQDERLEVMPTAAVAAARTGKGPPSDAEPGG